MQTMLVTGALGGIGRAVASYFADKARVVACVRNDDGLEMASDGNREWLAVDLCDSSAVMSALAHRQLDVMIHAAGRLGSAAAIGEGREPDAAGIIDANLVATINLLHAVVPGMMAQGYGHIVLCGSIAGYYPGLGPAIYSASKAANASLAQNLRLQLSNTDIRVTEVVPGRVNTGIHSQLNVGDLYGGYDCLSAQDIVQTIAFALSLPPHAEVTRIEIMPTRQAVGGGRFNKREPIR